VALIFESYPWKQDLQRRRSLIIKHNTKERFDSNFDATYTILEKCVFYSAFIIRKLIDCGSKLSDEADKYAITVKAIKPIKHISYMNRWPEEDSHDWENEKAVILTGKSLCNSLIHSYIFFFEFAENGSAVCFCVSSDFDKNKILYKVMLADWLNYMTFIATDNIVSLSTKYDEKEKGYIIVKKVRGCR
jgi:hypothetical protein